MNWDAKKVRYLWNLRKQHYGSAKVVTKSQRAPQKTLGDVLPICQSIRSEADMFKMLYLYYIYEFLQQKILKIPTLQRSWCPFFFRCGFFCPAPTPRLFVPKNPRPDRIFPCWHLPNESRPDHQWEGESSPRVEGWIAKKDDWNQTI